MRRFLRRLRIGFTIGAFLLLSMLFNDTGVASILGPSHVTG